MTLIGLLFAGEAAAAEPSLLLYINPQEYNHDVNIGLKPYYSRWVSRGPAAEAAARKTLGPHFQTVDVCEGNKTADVIVSISPRIEYNPAPQRYYARVKVRFYMGDGRVLGTLKATGHHEGWINSPFADDDVRLAFEDAMQNIAGQYAADSTIQANLHQAMQSDFTRTPCEMVGAIPGK
jgi:hypothetical protein